MSADISRRFGGIARLYGYLGAERLRSAHVCVVGIGGVGSWAMEALARTGVGQLTAVDLDMVAESNTNRQIHALDGIYGKAKVDAIAERIAQINPECRVTCIEDFVTTDNLAKILHSELTVVVDAIDQVKIKAAMIAHCHQQGTRIVVAGAAGGQMDPTQIQIADLTQTVQDPLLARVRTILRREYGFSREGKKKFGYFCSIFDRAHCVIPPRIAIRRTGCPGLNCSGFGSSVCVTSVFGMAAAAHAIKLILTR
jgi:tRNA A37 threonylcarbamoyladenosine dehydratase